MLKKVGITLSICFAVARGVKVTFQTSRGDSGSSAPIDAMMDVTPRLIRPLSSVKRGQSEYRGKSSVCVCGGGGAK